MNASTAANVTGALAIFFAPNELPYVGEAIQAPFQRA
jgi:hypothetical protein